MVVHAGRPVIGLRKKLCHYHVVELDTRLKECYHYLLTDDDEARGWIQTGKVRELTGPFSCQSAAEDA